MVGKLHRLLHLGIRYLQSTIFLKSISVGIQNDLEPPKSWTSPHNIACDRSYIPLDY